MCIISIGALVTFAGLYTWNSMSNRLARDIIKLLRISNVNSNRLTSRNSLSTRNRFQVSNESWIPKGGSHSDPMRQLIDKRRRWNPFERLATRSACYVISTFVPESWNIVERVQTPPPARSSSQSKTHTTVNYGFFFLRHFIRIYYFV